MTDEPVTPPPADARGGFAALDPCVHCGFCLPACPTYLATGDESDSPRGRILLMRAFERGELADDDAGLRLHLDLCLGCRGCEPVCPSGVGYGEGLEEARVRLARRNGLPGRVRAALAVFARATISRAAFGVARGIRRSGLARLAAGPGRLGFLAGMIEASRDAGDEPSGHPTTAAPAAPDRGTVALFRGCVMDGLFHHVHEATRRTLTLNGYRILEVAGQVCCGALHDHAGDREGAKALARVNLAAFLGQADYLVVDSAGCGALLKSLGHLLGGEAAARLARSVRDVTELLAAAGPRPGGPISRSVCYDAPCHLQHAQRIQADVLQVLNAIDGLDCRVLPGADRCCGAAGVYGVLHPAMSRAVLGAKLDAIEGAVPPPDLVATGNPGCLMQIGAGLLARRSAIRAVHPVELLDWSYREAGLYRSVN